MLVDLKEAVSDGHNMESFYNAIEEDVSTYGLDENLSDPVHIYS